jgi:hypothetical protein
MRRLRIHNGLETQQNKEDSQKSNLEIEKLQAEIRAIRAPFYVRTEFWVVFFGAIAAFGTILSSFITGYFDNQKLQIELKADKLQRETQVLEQQTTGLRKRNDKLSTPEKKDDHLISESKIPSSVEHLSERKEKLSEPDNSIDEVIDKKRPSEFLPRSAEKNADLDHLKIDSNIKSEYENNRPHNYGSNVHANCIVTGSDTVPKLALMQSKSEFCESMIQQLNKESVCETRRISLLYTRQSGIVQQYKLNEPYQEILVNLEVYRKPECAGREHQAIKLRQRTYADLAKTDILVDGQISAELQRILLP